MPSLRLLAFLLCLCCYTFLRGAPRYTISEFDIQQIEQQTAGKKITYSHACQINNLGQIVGLCYAQENHYSKENCIVYFWDKDIGFKIICSDDHHKSFPIINDNGVVAWTTANIPINPKHETLHTAYLWDTENNNVHRLEYNQPIVSAINNKNEILLANRHGLGASLLTVDLTKSPVVRKTVSAANFIDFFKDCEPKNKPKRQCSIALNNLSQFVGYIEFLKSQPAGTFTYHGFHWSPNNIDDIGVGMFPSDINDFGQIVGSMSFKSTKHAFLCQEGGSIIIQHNARAFAINNRGDIVGDIGQQKPSGEQAKAFGYIDGVLYELFNLITDNNGWTSLNLALDINDAGQIIGWGMRNGKLSGFLLNPTINENEDDRK